MDKVLIQIGGQSHPSSKPCCLSLALAFSHIAMFACLYEVFFGWMRSVFPVHSSFHVFSLGLRGACDYQVGRSLVGRRRSRCVGAAKDVLHERPLTPVCDMRRSSGARGFM